MQTIVLNLQSYIDVNNNRRYDNPPDVPQIGVLLKVYWSATARRLWARQGGQFSGECVTQQPDGTCTVANVPFSPGDTNTYNILVVDKGTTSTAPAVTISESGTAVPTGPVDVTITETFNTVSPHSRRSHNLTPTSQASATITTITKVRTTVSLHGCANVR